MNGRNESYLFLEHTNEIFAFFKITNIVIRDRFGVKLVLKRPM